MTDHGRSPDSRDIVDITAADRCDYCEWEPAAVILVKRDDATEWECYNCGHDPDDDGLRADGGEPIRRPPTPYEQAKHLARDDIPRIELLNMVADLPHVHYVNVDGDGESYRPTTVLIHFDNDHGRGTEDAAEIMRRCGWRFEGATFSPHNRLRFVKRGGDEA